MAYSLTYSGGTIIVPDGTLNSTSTSLSLPGRNYSGYGRYVNQDLVSMLEHFASSSGPVNQIRGQIWYDTSVNIPKVNVNGTSTGWVEFILSGYDAEVGNLDVAGTLEVNVISDGGTGGTITGNWDVVGNLSISDTLTVNSIETDGSPGTITGNWTLGPGSTLQATYADLAERFESDSEYEPGTVVELGGDKEVTAVKEDASESVFGVISNTAGYLMNAKAGNDATHPAIAMTGRVKVKVLGQVNKGDRLISAGSGYARSAKKGESTPFNTIGRALEEKLTDGTGKVLAAVSVKM
jgi:hypothetical protein